ncbi:tyrosine-type recombinase/integrase [Limnoglobus roseus]|uniref:Site-specific integrase n=1 Tax=Limnoglobus roseus TaxID=2598579 RepID=A0A5C1AG66_9BACT|nr:tyrosine-type recombinase/integrase [Limnoglobus roseus]QEL17137.1 site-specific integrase [Limnoglobus roseus]
MRIPAYCLHKPTGQAYVALSENGKRRTIYLGVWGTPQSRRRYAEVIASLDGPASGGTIPKGSASTPPTPLPPSSTPPTGLSLADAYALWIAHARTYYPVRAGTTSQVENIERSWEPLLTLFPEARIETLTKKNYTAVREEMIRRGWARKTIQRRWNLILLGLRWLAGEESIPDAAVLTATLPRLRPHRSAAPELPPIRPVPLVVVRATQEKLNPVLRSMVELQLLTGMRPGEVRELRKSDLVWADGLAGEGVPVAVQISHHKTAYRGRPRLVPLSPTAGRLVADRLAIGDSDCDWVFTLFRALKKKGTPYKRRIYGLSIHKACDRAGVPRWHPNQIRHWAATEVRKHRNLDAARALLGHSETATTEIYAEMDAEAAKRAAEALEKALNPPPPPTPEAPPTTPPTPPPS